MSEPQTFKETEPDQVPELFFPPVAQEQLAAISLGYYLSARAFSDPYDSTFSETAVEIYSPANPTKFSELFSALQTLLAQWGKLGSNSENCDKLASLQSEYTRLFLTGLLCPHHESDYVGDTVFRKTSLLADLAGFYRAFGFQVASQSNAQVDFIGTELEFLALLSGKELYALQNGQTEQKTLCRSARIAFLKEHLGRWANAFCQILKQQATSPFYLAAARAVEEIVKAEIESLQITPEPLNPLGESSLRPAPGILLAEPEETKCGFESNNCGCSP